MVLSPEPEKLHDDGMENPGDEYRLSTSWFSQLYYHLYFRNYFLHSWYNYYVGRNRRIAAGIFCLIISRVIRFFIYFPKKYKSKKWTKTISQITVHPIKGCRGVNVDECKLFKRGLENDREFAIVCEVDDMIKEKGDMILTKGKSDKDLTKWEKNELETRRNCKYQVITPRDIPQLLLLKPRLPVKDEKTGNSSMVIELTYPEHGPGGVTDKYKIPEKYEKNLNDIIANSTNKEYQRYFTYPLNINDSKKNKKEKILMWGNIVEGIDQGDQVSEWLTTHLTALKRNGDLKNVPKLRLMKFSQREGRIDSDGFQHPNQLPPTRFSDQTPLLIGTDTTTHCISRSVITELSWKTTMRYRFNILIGGCELPFEEDCWRSFDVYPTNKEEEERLRKLEEAKREKEKKLKEEEEKKLAAEKLAKEKNEGGQQNTNGTNAITNGPTSGSGGAASGNSAGTTVAAKVSSSPTKKEQEKEKKKEDDKPVIKEEKYQIRMVK